MISAGDLTRIIGALQEALDQLDQHNVGTARRATFEVLVRLREALDQAELEELCQE